MGTHGSIACFPTAARAYRSMKFFHAAVLAALLAGQAASQAADPATIDTVHVVSLCHLDAGYKYSYVSEVVTEWMQVWVPASIALSDEMRRRGGEAQHRWTMNPWKP